MYEHHIASISHLRVGRLLDTCTVEKKSLQELLIFDGLITCTLSVQYLVVSVVRAVSMKGEI